MNPGCGVLEHRIAISARHFFFALSHNVPPRRILVKLRFNHRGSDLGVSSAEGRDGARDLRVESGRRALSQATRWKPRCLHGQPSAGLQTRSRWFNKRTSREIVGELNQAGAPVVVKISFWIRSGVDGRQPAILC
jgi:hypothetical protein